MFDNLSAKLDRAFKNIKGQGRITELNVAATETWMVGDNIDWEVIAPQKLGIFSIWRDPRGYGILPEGTLAKPDRIIRKLSELKSG